MGSDRARISYDPRKQYRAVIAQQGRVTLEADWNEAQQMNSEAIRQETLDIVGTSGTPDDGYRVLEAADSSTPYDFAVQGGTMYVGGVRVFLGDPAQPIAPSTSFRFNYSEQSDPSNKKDNFSRPAEWLDHQTDPFWVDPLHISPNREWVYLLLQEQEISAVEDLDLIELALGGPDTTQRSRLIQRIIRLNLESNENPSCAAGLEAGQAQWQKLGLTFNPTTLRLTSNTELMVEFVEPETNPSACEPGSRGGYLEADNQLIRIQVGYNRTTKKYLLLWGFDNASAIYQIDQNIGSSAVVQLNQPFPVDEFHKPNSNQFVEVLGSAARLSSTAYAASVTGDVYAIQSYDAETHQLTLTELISNEVATAIAAAPQAYVRIWEGMQEIDTSAHPFIMKLKETGLQVKLQTAENQTLHVGDYWAIAVRPGVSNQETQPSDYSNWQQIYPQRYLEEFQVPEGPRLWACPLAVLSWQESDDNLPSLIVQDCRQSFMPLSRRGTCCTLTVGDGSRSFGDINPSDEQPNPIQAAVEGLTDGGQICVLPGEYPGNITIQGKRNLTIRGCGDRTRLVAVASEGNHSPIIQIDHSQQIRIEALSIFAGNNAGIQLKRSVSESVLSSGAFQESQQTLSHITLTDLYIRAATRSAIEVQQGEFVTISNCLIEMEDVFGPWPGVYFIGDDGLIEGNTIQVIHTDSRQPSRQIFLRAFGGLLPKYLPGTGLGGLQLGGGCTRVRVIGNLIQSGMGHGICLGNTVERDEAGHETPPDAGWIPGMADPCSRSRPASILIRQDESINPEYKLIWSAGQTLREITIQGNRIYGMGLGGISISHFFDLKDRDEFFTVDYLSIIGNEIRNCLWRDLEDIPPNMLTSMGYGAIALADGSYLVIRDNVIENNGSNYLEPICGIFVLHGEGIEISGNRIVNNGAKTDKPVEGAKPGPRGGVVIMFAVAPTIPFQIIPGGTDTLPNIDTLSKTDTPSKIVPGQNGVPALTMYHNIVSAPLGQALSVGALGPVSVVANQLTTQGIVLARKLTPSMMAATIAIVDLGISNELYFQLIGASQAQITLENGVLKFPPQPGLDDIRLGKTLTNGNVLFVDNQCSLDLLENRTSVFDWALSSIFISSLDDISFHNNQCDCNLFRDFVLSRGDFVLSQAFLFSPSLRVSDNRFKEGFFSAFLSATTIGLMNMTTDNQATHCLFIFGAQNQKNHWSGEVQQPNTILFDFFQRTGDYCSSYINGLKELLKEAVNKNVNQYGLRREE